MYIKEKNVRAHGGATWHAWLWVYGNDGTIYWIDPTWTDNARYVWWGVVQDGKEVQRPPLQDLCMVTISSNSEAMAYTDSGNANKSKGNNDQAIEDYTAALRIDPNYANAYYNRGNAYRDKNMDDRAIEDYNAALRIDPNHAVAYNNRGIAYYGKGNLTQARADWTKALQLDPNNQAARNNLASTGS